MTVTLRTYTQTTSTADSAGTMGAAGRDDDRCTAVRETLLWIDGTARDQLGRTAAKTDRQSEVVV